MSDLRKQILDFDDSSSETVQIPQWGGVKVEVRSLTAGQRGRLLKVCTDEETGEIDAGKLSIHLTIATAHDPETGERIFQPDDYDALGEKAPKAIEAIMDVAARLSALTEEEVESYGPSSSEGTTASIQRSGSPSTSQTD